MLMFGNHDSAYDHVFALCSKFRELITIQEECVINRLFLSILAWIRALGSLRVPTRYSTRYRGEHHHRDVQLICQRFQTATYLAELLEAILVPLPMNTWLNQMQIVNHHECDTMGLDYLLCSLSQFFQ